MSEQQVAPEASESPAEGMSDDQLIDGNELIEAASNGFMSSTFNIPVDGGASPQAPKPTEDAFAPSSEEDEKGVEVSSQVVELERLAADLRHRERELEDRERYLSEPQAERLRFREQPKEAFERWVSDEYGLDSQDAFRRLASSILDEDHEQVAVEREGRERREQEDRIGRLESQLQSQAYEEEERELYFGLSDMVEQFGEEYPIARSMGGAATGEVWQHIIDHQARTGEVLDARDVFQQYEDNARKQIEALRDNEVVRRYLGLAAKQNGEPRSVSAREVVQGTPTLTNQSAGERSVLSSQDEMLDDDDIIRLASEAFLGG